MAESIFDYHYNKTKIKEKINDSIQTIIQDYLNKRKLDIKKNYFTLKGKQLNNNEKIQNILNGSQKQNDCVKKLNDIICPICKEICQYKMKDHRIKLYDCKNGHIKENIKLNEFKKTQFINLKCDNCKKENKPKDFYICNQCNIYLCSICKSNHNKEHIIINYDDKNYICNIHNRKYEQYCEDCNEDICSSCLDEHEDHFLNSYEDKLKEIKSLRKKMNYLRKAINKFKDNLEETIIKMKKIMEYMDIYYNINDYILNIYESNDKINYNKSKNIDNIKESIRNEFVNLKDIYNYGFNLNKIFYLYNELVDENKEITMYYKINPNREKEEKIRIFGKEFVNNNIDKCKIIYYDRDNHKDKECELKEYFEDINYYYNNKDSFSFKLKGINNITDMSHMFDGCNSILELPDISEWDTSKVNNMSYMFRECELISSLPDLSNWDTLNVTDMSFMFYKCKSLISLPDISKWKTSNVVYLHEMFRECKLLNLLPDISKWDISNTLDIYNMFYKCKSLRSLPPIEKWDISWVNRKSYMFEGCDESLVIPKKFLDEIENEENDDNKSDKSEDSRFF